jgi:uncharacterized membrane protein
MISSPLALAATIAGCTALGLWLEHRFGWARKVGASLLVIAFGAVLANAGLVPKASPVYDAVSGTVTSLAVVWLLLAVRLADLRAAGGRMLGAFGIAAAATFVGAVGAALAFAPVLGPAVRPEAWKLAGVLTGTYTGGSLNFAAVGRELALPDSLFAAAAAADNVMTAVWMGATLVLPVWLRRLYPAPPAEAWASRDAGESAEREAEASAGAAGKPATAARGAAAGGADEPASAPADRSAQARLTGEPLRPLDVTVLLALALGLLLAAEALAARVGGVAILWLTTLALLAAQLPPVRRLRGALPLGVVALNLFFVTIGIGSRFAEIARVGPEVFYLTAAVVAVHGLLTFGFARLARLDAETTAVASQAAVGGPSTALALAIARGRPGLALPGLMAGLLGYAVGNYAGLAAAWLVRGWLG